MPKTIDNPMVRYRHHENHHQAYCTQVTGERVILYRGNNMQVALAIVTVANHYIKHNPSNNLDQYIKQFLIERS